MESKIRSAVESGNISGSVHETLERSANAFPKNVAIIFGKIPFTYERINELSSRFAEALVAMGLKDGDRVACYLPSSPQFMIVFYGTLKAGGVLTPIDHRYREVELKYQLSDSEAKIIVTLDSLWEKSKDVILGAGVTNAILANLTEIEDLNKVRNSGTEKDSRRKSSGSSRLVDLIEQTEPIERSVRVDPYNHIAAMPYTTGTTGPSKGVMLSHFNLLASQYQFNDALGNKVGKETAIVIFPFSHIGGLNAALGTLVHSSNTVVAFEKFDSGRVLEAVTLYRPTLFYGVPSAYVTLLNDAAKIREADFSCVRVAISSGSPLPPEIKLQFEKEAGVGITDSWGMTESSPVLTCSPPGETQPHLIGYPVLETQVRVVDTQDESRELPIGEVGVLIAKGPQVMLGYWKKQEETRKILKDGWLHTGDLGYKDETGAFFYLDRKKDIINVGGLKVWPAEVEAVIYECPSVAETIVGAEPSERYGETVTAWVVLKPGFNAIDEDKLIKDHCSSKLARYKVPNTIEFVREIPKSHVGKPLRRAIREFQRGRPPA